MPPTGTFPRPQRRLLFKGTEDFYGIDDFFEHLQGKRYKLHVRVFLSRYRSAAICPVCKGARLKPEALSVKVGGLDIAQVSAMPVGRSLRHWFQELGLTGVRAAGGEGDPAPAGDEAFLLPAGGARLSHARPADADALGRRGPAREPLEPACAQTDRHALRAGRAEHRAAPARHRPACGDHPGAGRGRTIRS